MKPERIEFYTELGKIGHLDWSDGKLIFSGDADDSARAFFDNLSALFFVKLQEAYEEGYMDAKKEKIN